MIDLMDELFSFIAISLIILYIGPRFREGKNRDAFIGGVIVFALEYPVHHMLLKDPNALPKSLFLGALTVMLGYGFYRVTNWCEAKGWC